MPDQRRRTPVQRSEQRTVRRDRPRRTPWTRYGLELVVIVVGIMISFLLNEWRQGLKESAQERRLLENLHADLRSDSLAIRAEIQAIDASVVAAKRLSMHDSISVPPDSIRTYLWRTLVYSAVPFNQVTYRELLTTGKADLLQDEDLLRQLMELHEQHYFMIREYGLIDKGYVLDRMFPLVERHVLLEDPDPPQFDALMSDIEWRNLIHSSIFFKGKIIDLLRAELDRSDKLLRRIEMQMQE